MIPTSLSLCTSAASALAFRLFGFHWAYSYVTEVFKLLQNLLTQEIDYQQVAKGLDSKQAEPPSGEPVFGVLRGACMKQSCSCQRYQPDRDSFKEGGPCLNCGHYPTKHEVECIPAARQRLHLVCIACLIQQLIGLALCYFVTVAAAGYWQEGHISFLFTLLDY